MRSRNKVWYCFPIFLVAAGTLCAAPPVERCKGSGASLLDFWIGDWDVYSGSERVGYNTISKTSNGCLVVERWSGTDGDLGVSFNFLDEAGALRQTYVGPAWSVDYHGAPDGPGVLLRSHVDFKGERFAIRLSLQPQPDGSVRQHKESSKREDIWRTVYDYKYVRTGKSVSVSDIHASLPQCAAGDFHRLDFWAGSWTVFSQAQLDGHNRIERASGGCSLIENWTGSDGTEGKSLNFYDTSRHEWRQIWVSPDVLLDLHGDWREGELAFTGVSAGRNGELQHQLTFKPAFNPVDGVRQIWKMSKDGGKTWVTVFDGSYRRVS